MSIEKKRFLSTEFLISVGVETAKKEAKDDTIQQKLLQTCQIKDNPPASPEAKVFSQQLKLTSPRTAMRKGEAEAEKWKRNQHTTQNDLDLKTLIGLLNKLSVETFPALSKQISALLYNPYMMEKGIDLIVEKALMEAHFSTMYAILCLFLSDHSRKWDDLKTGQKITFKRLLLNKCCDVFENLEPPQLSLDVNTLEKEEALTRWRRRSLGNMKFIGALYLENLLPEKIIYECIESLLEEEPKTDLVIEMLCSLITVTGSGLQNDKHPQRLAHYFEQIEALVLKKTLTNRINFMLMDLIDLRRDNWVPRKQVKGPTTLKEAREDASKNSTTLDRPKKSKTMPASSISSSSPSASAPSKVSGTPRFHTSNTGEKERGSSKGFSAKTKSPTATRKSPLSKSIDMPSRRKEAKSNLSATLPSALSSSLSASRSPPSSSPRKVAFAEPQQKKVMDKEKFLIEVEKLILELLTSEEVDEAALCLEELDAVSLHQYAVTKAIEIFVEKPKPKEHQLITDLLLHCYNSNLLTKKDIQNGLELVCEDLDEIRVDSPKAPIYVGQLIAALIHKQVLSLLFLIEDLANLPHPKSLMNQLFTSCLDRLYFLYGRETFVKIFSSADFKISGHLAADNSFDLVQAFPSLGLQ